MRIRKRQVQLPLSSISPNSSDPNFNQSPVVQHPPRQQPPPPSDHPNHPIRRQQPTQGRDSSAFPETTTTIRTTHGKQLKKKEDYLVLKQGEDGRGENGEKSTCTTRKRSVFGEELGTGSLSHQAIGSWFEGEKAFPLKKRRGSFERIMQKNNDINNHNCGKKSTLVEGSRCSRVNGRGWRCCQQTLVGYSLCEHHLGKGRLRSISNNNAAKKEEQPPLLKQGSENGDEKPLMTTIKKRVKLGMVKARSISSLLSENDNVIAISDDN